MLGYQSAENIARGYHWDLCLNLCCPVYKLLFWKGEQEGKEKLLMRSNKTKKLLWRLADGWLDAEWWTTKQQVKLSFNQLKTFRNTISPIHKGWQALHQMLLFKGLDVQGISVCCCVKIAHWPGAVIQTTRICQQTKRKERSKNKKKKINTKGKKSLSLGQQIKQWYT